MCFFKSKYLLLLLITSIGLSGIAQEKTRLLLSLDRKSSLFHPTKVNTLGVRVGYKYGCKVNVGFGVYRANNITFDYQLDAFNYPNASTSLEAQINYVNLFVEPILLSEKRKLFSLPLSVGGGNINVKYRELNTTKTKTYFNDFAPVIDVGGVFLFKTVPFVWLGGGVGYRHFFHRNDLVHENFNAPYFMIKLKLGRPCKKAGVFYKWRKNLFDKKNDKKKEGIFDLNKKD
ncbi:MAG: hypothetical protein N4A35_06330 [Flavobacteriales bacterium]|jgi:hypothetical protein|nr:hypothetical protein [Flavobacteriales bacterium]